VPAVPLEGIVASRAAGEHRPRLRVAVLTSSYPRGEGDFAGRFVADTVASLRAQGVAVEVVHPSLPVDGGGVVRFVRRRPWMALVLPIRLLIELRRVARDADLVHANWLAAAAIARFAGKPFVVTLHGTGSAGRLSDLSLIRRSPRLVRFLLRPAGRVICVSRELTGAVRSIGIEHASYVPNGVSVPERRPASRASATFVLYVGRLSPEKGIADLVAATEGMQLVVAGDGPLRHLIPSALGFVPHDQVLRLMREASVIVMPSRQDGSPVALLEAMANECAIVATSVGGIPDAVEDGVTGLLVDPLSPLQLRAAIERLLASPDLRRRLGAAAGARAREQHSWQRVTSATLDAYTLALTARQRKRSSVHRERTPEALEFTDATQPPIDSASPSRVL